MAGATIPEVRAELFGMAFVLAQHLGRRGDACLEALDLTTRQWLLLAVVHRGFPDRPPTLSESAAEYGTSRQNVKQIALQLQARGFLDLVPDAHDARSTRLVVTDRVAVFDGKDHRAREAALFDSIFDDFSPGDLRRLRGLLRRWLRVVTSDGDDPQQPPSPEPASRTT